MRISIWQQFSSNHSSSFTVVGKFGSTEKTIGAEIIFKQLLKRIREYREYDARIDGNEDAPTWPEVEIAEQYGFKWDAGIDWVYEDADINEHVIRFEDYVFVTTAITDTWQGPESLQNLMQKLTDAVHLKVHEHGEDKIILTQLECEAPNQEMSDFIYKEVVSYLKSTDIENLTAPWKPYLPIHEGRLEPYFESEADVLGGKIEQDAQIIHFPEIAFFETQYGLPALIGYLEAKGCVNIRYSLQSVPYVSRREYM